MTANGGEGTGSGVPDGGRGEGGGPEEAVLSL